MTGGITFDEVVQLAQKLPMDEQQHLIEKLLEHQRQTSLSAEEKIALLRSVMFTQEILNVPSIRRVDWYDDDGR